MSWVVDSCVVLDVALKDPDYGLSSALFLEDRRKNGLTVCPITVIEIAPFFDGDVRNVREFLTVMGVEPMAPWMEADTEAGVQAWARYVRLKREGMADKRPIADILIGAFAARHEGLVTRNPDHFRPFFPQLVLAEPPRATPTRMALTQAPLLSPGSPGGSPSQAHNPSASFDPRLAGGLALPGA